MVFKPWLWFVIDLSNSLLVAPGVTGQKLESSEREWCTTASPSGSEKLPHSSVACVSTLPTLVWCKVIYITNCWLWVLLFHLPIGKKYCTICYSLCFERPKLEQRINCPKLLSPETEGQWVCTNPAFKPTGPVLENGVQEELGLPQSSGGVSQVRPLDSG